MNNRKKISFFDTLLSIWEPLLQIICTKCWAWNYYASEVLTHSTLNDQFKSLWCALGLLLYSFTVTLFFFVFLVLCVFVFFAVKIRNKVPHNIIIDRRVHQNGIINELLLSTDRRTSSFWWVLCSSSLWRSGTVSPHASQPPIVKSTTRWLRWSLLASTASFSSFSRWARSPEWLLFLSLFDRFRAFS